MEIIGLGTILTLVLLVFAILVAYKCVAIVPQSEEFVVERFGRYRRDARSRY